MLAAVVQAFAQDDNEFTRALVKSVGALDLVAGYCFERVGALPENF
jgi:hypothetical protein